MSQVPAVTASEPQTALPGPKGTSAGAGQPAVDVAAMQQRLEKLQAENDTLQTYRGWQKEFTRANQTGVYKILMDAAEKPGGVQAYLDSIKQTSGLKGEVEALGGLDKIREAAKFYEDVMTPGASPANPQGGTPAQAPAQVPGLTAEDVRKIVLEVSTAQSRQQQLNDAYADVSDQILETLGIGESDVASKKCRTLLKDEAVGLAQGRDVTLEDITVAAQSIQQFLAGLRAQGAQVAASQTQRQPQTPPGMNGPGAGGQVPGKSPSEMTEAEINARIEARARAAGLGSIRQPTNEDLPPGFRFGH